MEILNGVGEQRVAALILIQFFICMALDISCRFSSMARQKAIKLMTLLFTPLRTPVSVATFQLC